MDHQNDDDNLLTDEQFEQLMEAEFNHHAPVVDEIKKAQVWQAIEKEITSSTKQSVWAWFPLIAASLMVMVLLPFMMFSEESRTKGTSDAVFADLSAFKLLDSGQLQTANRPASPGDTIVFRYHVSQSVVAAFLLSKQNQQPNIRFTGRLEPGTNRLLQQKQHTYGYLIDPVDRQLKFCLLVAKDQKMLDVYLRDLDQTWRSLPEASCQIIAVKS